MDIFESLNSVLVDLFNDILNIEERALITEEFKDISVTDMHIIEAIGIEEPRTMSTISKSLGVTMGTLTVGINGLVKKGYDWTYHEGFNKRRSRGSYENIYTAGRFLPSDSIITISLIKEGYYARQQEFTQFRRFS